MGDKPTKMHAWSIGGSGKAAKGPAPSIEAEICVTLLELCGVVGLCSAAFEHIRWHAVGGHFPPCLGFSLSGVCAGPHWHKAEGHHEYLLPGGRVRFSGH